VNAGLRIEGIGPFRRACRLSGPVWGEFSGVAGVLAGFGKMSSMPA
jgi:hypothetical protein